MSGDSEDEDAYEGEDDERPGEVVATEKYLRQRRGNQQIKSSVTSSTLQEPQSEPESDKDDDDEDENTEGETFDIDQPSLINLPPRGNQQTPRFLKQVGEPTFDAESPRNTDEEETSDVAEFDDIEDFFDGEDIVERLKALQISPNEYIKSRLNVAGGKPMIMTALSWASLLRSQDAIDYFLDADTCGSVADLQLPCIDGLFRGKTALEVVSVTRGGADAVTKNIMDTLEEANRSANNWLEEFLNSCQVDQVGIVREVLDRRDLLDDKAKAMSFLAGLENDSWEVLHELFPEEADRDRVTHQARLVIASNKANKYAEKEETPMWMMVAFQAGILLFFYLVYRLLSDKHLQDLFRYYGFIE